MSVAETGRLEGEFIYGGRDDIIGHRHRHYFDIDIPSHIGGYR